MSERSPESKRLRRLATLERRVTFLKGRVANYTGASDSRDRAELGALQWALAVIRAAGTMGTLDELERVALGPAANLCEVCGLPMQRVNESALWVCHPCLFPAETEPQREGGSDAAS